MGDVFMSDLVNNPEHYKAGGIETIDFIQAKLSDDEFIGYLKGNLFKYLSRAGKKNDEVQDLEKAQWYLRKLLEQKEKKNEKHNR